MRVTKATNKLDIKVSIDIRPGPAAPAQKSQYRRLWAKLLSQAKDDLKAESEARCEQK